jgi:hypothetical protein
VIKPAIDRSVFIHFRWRINSNAIYGTLDTLWFQNTFSIAMVIKTIQNSSR